jgi:quercetin dioxygenase-like cupin family protein
MSLVRFDSNGEALGSDSYRTGGTGVVHRGQAIEVSRISFEKGRGADVHQHPEEQVMYVLSGRLRVTCGDETYDVGPGEATYNASNVPHGVTALEDVVALSVKSEVRPNENG